MTVRLEDIEAAARIIAGKAIRTPSLRAASLSNRFGADILLKLENLQLTGSFKTRGALVKLTSLTKAETRRGVIAISAGATMRRASPITPARWASGRPSSCPRPRPSPRSRIPRSSAPGSSSKATTWRNAVASPTH